MRLFSFDAELKGRPPSDLGLDSMQGMIGKFYAWVGRFLQAAACGFAIVMDKGADDPSCFNKDGAIVLSGEAERTIEGLSSVLGLELMKKASALFNGIKALKYMMGDSPVKLLVCVSGCEISDVGVLEGLAELLSKLKSIDSLTQKALNFGSGKLDSWIKAGGVAAEKSVGNIMRPKLTAMNAVIFKDAEYWQKNDSGALIVESFIRESDQGTFTEQAAKSADFTAVDQQMVHVENICVAVDKVHVAVILRAAWLVTKARWTGSAVQTWLLSATRSRIDCDTDFRNNIRLDLTSEGSASFSKDAAFGILALPIPSKCLYFLGCHLSPHRVHLKIAPPVLYFSPEVSSNAQGLVGLDKVFGMYAASAGGRRREILGLFREAGHEQVQDLEGAWGFHLRPS